MYELKYILLFNLNKVNGLNMCGLTITVKY